MNDLSKIREEIDRVDKQLLELFEYRMGLSLKVADYKKGKDMPVYDPAREEEKLTVLKEMVKNRSIPRPYRICLSR